MKQLNYFINEKLKINSKSKLNINYLFDRIISLLNIPEERLNDSIKKNINNWINGNLLHNKKVIHDVIPIAYPTIIEILEKQGVKKEITDEYKTHNSLENCEMCEDESNMTYHLYSDNKYELRYNENILSFKDYSDPNYPNYDDYALYLFNDKTFIDQSI